MDPIGIEHTIKREELPQVKTLMWLAETGERDARELAQRLDIIVARYHDKLAAERVERIIRHVGHLTDLAFDLRSILLIEAERDRAREPVWEG